MKGGQGGWVKAYCFLGTLQSTEVSHNLANFTVRRLILTLGLNLPALVKSTNS